MSLEMRATDADWLGLSRAATVRIGEILAAAPTSTERVRETGERGEGGDQTLIIDADAEAAIFELLDGLHAGGARFCAVSEERGTVDFGDDAVRVVIDPLDGSLNAKRGMSAHAVSIAVADGPTMADVFFGFVADLGTGEEWTAQRGQGARLDGRLLTGSPSERRTSDGRLELVAIESSDPRWLARSVEALREHVHRVRALGAMAISLSQVAAVRVDGMASLARTRAVDVAAAQLIVRESGGLVAFTTFDDPLGAPLDLEPHSPIVAARTPEAITALSTVASHHA